MPIAICRPGVPPKPRETAFVTQLIEATKIPGFVHGIANQAPAVGVDADVWERYATAQTGLRAELAAMTDVEFAAFLADEELPVDSYIASAYREQRS